MLRRWLPLVAASIPISLFYLWTASPGLSFGVGEPHDGLCNLQA
jgi:hypothetical protein